MHARGFHVLVMTATLTRIKPNEQLATIEQFRPGLERIQVIER